MQSNSDICVLSIHSETNWRKREPDKKRMKQNDYCTKALYVVLKTVTKKYANTVVTLIPNLVAFR